VSLGYEADRYKLLAFVLSAALAGLAGATKAMVLQFATLTDVSAATSGEVVLMALVGGLGTITGPVVGALHHRHHAELPGLDRRVRAGDFRAPSSSFIVMAFRKGLVGELAEWWRRRSAPKTQPGAGGLIPRPSGRKS